MKRVKRISRTREWRPEICVEPEILVRIVERQHFRLNEVAIQRQENEQALLMRWVRREMGRRLTPRERQIVELYYLEVMTLEEVARQKKVHFSTVSRSLRRAMGKLRAAAREIAGEQPSRKAVLKAMEEE